MQATANDRIRELRADDAAAERAAYDKRHAANVMASAVRWAMQNPAAVLWIEEHAGKDEFAASLAEQLNRKGFLTGPQTEAVGRAIARGQAQSAGGVAAPAAPTITVERIEAAFVKAKESGLIRLHLNLDTFTFKPAKPTGANPGGIYVTEAGSGKYLGKVLGGKFLRTRECTSEQEQRIVAAASDPAAAAIAYGKQTGRCAVCNLLLTADDSVERGIGPICATKYGW